MDADLPTMQVAKRDPSGSAGSGGETSTLAWLNEDRIKNPVGGEARGPGEMRGRDRCVTLLGGSHQGWSEAEHTLTMSSHGVEISIARGGADEKDRR